jgi:predicted transcriptional regulator
MWLFGKKNKANKNDEAELTGKEAAVEKAMAQFRQTREELGPETVEAMERAMRLEQVKNQIKDAIDNKEGTNREAVLTLLAEMSEKTKH